MGVKTLWSIIAGFGEPTDLRELMGQKLAIDLAGWVVSGLQCRGLSNNVNNAHIRNVFFRTVALLELGIKPIFILDGKPPKLKKITLMNRRNAENGRVHYDDIPSEVMLSRNRLASLLGECREMLECLGVPCLYSSGEAEKLCAELNDEALVDAVITDDSDIWCYGGSKHLVVLRGFSLNRVERFRFDCIVTSSLNLDRQKMTFMAITLGCDLLPEGILGVGKESVLQLFRLWPPRCNAISALKIWMGQSFADSILTHCQICFEEHSSHCQSCLKWSGEVVPEQDFCLCKYYANNKELIKCENNIKKKCRLIEPSWWIDQFPSALNEFQRQIMNSKLRLEAMKTQTRPNVSAFMRVMTRKMNWTPEYCVERILPLLTRWHIVQKVPDSMNVMPKLRALRIVKRRRVNGIPCLVVNWSLDAGSCLNIPKEYESTEPLLHVQSLFPELVSSFDETKKNKGKGKKVASKITPESTKITNYFTRNTPLSTTATAVTTTDVEEEHQCALSSSSDLSDDSLENVDLSCIIDEMCHRLNKTNLTSDIITNPCDDV